MFGLIKKIFIGLLTGVLSASNLGKYLSMSNQKCMTQPFLVNLHLNEYSKKFNYYPFAVKLHICVGSCNALNDLSHKVSVPNKTEALNLIVFNMITEINESKRLTKYISCERKCKFDGRKCSLNQWWNNDKCWCEYKKHHLREKDYAWNPATCSCENGKYLATATDDLVITSDNCMYTIWYVWCHTRKEKKYSNKSQENLYILLAFLLITRALLIAVSIYCYLIKCWEKQKHFYHFTSEITS